MTGGGEEMLIYILIHTCFHYDALEVIATKRKFLKCDKTIERICV